MQSNIARVEECNLCNTNILPLVIFAHGKESGPRGAKILALADVAKSHGCQVESIDFRGMNDPEERVKHLIQIGSAKQRPLILVGSSMGGYVVLRASKVLPTVGLFLLAPAVGLDGYQNPVSEPGCECVTIVHAWQDDIIPVRNVINYAERYQAELHLVNSDHRLNSQIPLLVQLFERFLGHEEKSSASPGV